MQEALITYLNSKTGITSLTTDIKELNYQGVDFSYPLLRVRVDQIVPIYPLEQCDRAIASWEIIAESEPTDTSSSSLDVSRLAAAVVNNIKRKNINAAGIKTSPVRIIMQNGPTSKPQRGWRQRIFCEAIVV